MLEDLGQRTFHSGPHEMLAYMLIDAGPRETASRVSLFTVVRQIVLASSSSFLLSSYASRWRSPFPYFNHRPDPVRVC